MKKYSVELTSEPSTSYYCQAAANSLDIDINKKLKHCFSVSADIESEFTLGLILGASGSGKTTLAKSIYGGEFEAECLDLTRPVIDQFPEGVEYRERAKALSGVGLTSVVCWIRPACTLSNGQRARAEIALRLYSAQETIIVDEWTSVVDRTVAKVMSHCVQKFARRNKKKIVLLSCHYDVIDWLNPDWVIDCNKATYENRRCLWREFKRTEQLKFEIKEVGRETWPYFSKYHYLSDKLPGGIIETYGLFHGKEQIGFQCFANYVPKVKGKPTIMHSNRTVIHPDYAGLGLGILLINETSRIMKSKGFDVMAKYSSTPVHKAMQKYKEWKLLKIERDTKTEVPGNQQRKTGFRKDVKTFSYRFIG